MKRRSIIGGPKRTSDVHGREDGAGDGSAERRRSEADDFVTGCGLDQGHRDLLWRLEYFPELSFEDPDGALVGGHVNVVGARSHRKLPCDEQVNDRESLTRP